MTISQSSSSLGPGPRRGGLWSAALRTVRHWQEQRRARADLARLTQIGDYLLRDVGIDPEVARKDPSAATARLLRRSR